MCFHASLGVAQLKPAVYHSSLPCVTSKLHHAWFGLFMTQSQEGHACLRWALCNKTWTHVKKNTPHLPILLLFFFQGYHVRKFLSRFWVQQDCGEISLALDSSGIFYPCHVSFTQLQLKNSFENYLAIENLSLLAVFCLFSVLLGNLGTVMTWEGMTRTKERIKETGCIKYGGQRAGQKKNICTLT